MQGGFIEVKYIAFLLLCFFHGGDLRQNKAFQLLSGFDIYLGIVFFLSPVSKVSTNILQNIPKMHNFSQRFTIIFYKSQMSINVLIWKERKKHFAKYICCFQIFSYCTISNGQTKYLIVQIVPKISPSLVKKMKSWRKVLNIMWRWRGC